MSRRQRWSVLHQQERLTVEFGFALWRNEDDRGWRFSHAFVNGAMLGARSIVEALK
jgi:hypothetical protein